MGKYKMLKNKIYVTLILGITLFLFGAFVRSVKHYPIWWWFLPYERSLCDNASQLHAYDAKLRCYYVQRNFLYNYKIEQLHTNPDLIAIRQFVFDMNEIKWLMDFTREYSDASPVYTLITDLDFEKKLMQLLDFRTSNTHTVPPWMLRSLYTVAERASGLNVSNLDGWFDILWYRKYGHIIPHHDVYPNSDSAEDGRRFATMIVYLYEPEDGGATIFPKLGIATKPNAGDAILWYNVKVNNEPDPLLDHAGCPVWKGEKFIGTFWFRQFYQEFRKPCPIRGQRFRFN